LNNVISFFHSISILKETIRSGWKEREIEEVFDSTASHTFGVLFLTWLFSKKIKFDVEKALKMALIHDILECITGDFIPGEIEKDERQRLEHEALKIFYEKTPLEIRDEIADLVVEYIEGKTQEAKVVESCDKLDTAFQALYYAKTSRTEVDTAIVFKEWAEEFIENNVAATLIKKIDEEIKKIK
jgi:putative hydrolase of HD superfamily